MKVERYKCDKCGAMSNGEGTEGWIELTANGEAIVARPLTGRLPWSEALHCCGMECAMSVAQRELRKMLGAIGG